MAIYGIGAKYGDEDVSNQFIENGIACVGWDEEQSPTLHSILRHIKVGDIIYIKSHPPNIGLIVKAVGIVTDTNIVRNDDLGNGITTRWIWTGEDRIGKFEDKYPVRNLTLYEEYNFEIQSRVLQLFLDAL